MTSTKRRTEQAAPCRPHSRRHYASRRRAVPEGIHQRRLTSPLGIVKTVDQCLCSFEIGSFETLVEPIVDRREKRDRLCGPIVVAQQPGEARGSAQFPGQGALPARPTERLLVVIFGRRRSSGSSLQQKKLAFDAQQVGDAPAVFIALGSRQRLVDCVQSLSDLPGASKPFCKLAKILREVWLEAGFGRLLKSGAQKPQASVEIAVPDQQDSVEAMSPSSPDGQPVCSGAVEQHRDIAFGCRQIASD
jgi:hypothetical protein